MQPTFGRYELLKRIASGGMGEVYLARLRGIEGFQRLLVLKTLLPHLCEDEEFIAMFKDEARVTAQLVHPNICQVFELEQVNGIYFMAMEYLHGEDLRRVWRACARAGRPLPLPLVCRIVSDAAAGLDFAHALRDARGQPYGIVHRDVSPQNVVVTFEGGVKLIDFGVAKAAGRAQHTRTGVLKGKSGYMSPEQVMGAAIDRRSDVFALGVVLHELLTGERLFKADSDVQTLWRVRECEVRRPSEVNARVPVALDAFVSKALAKDPEDRFQTAQELRLALEEWLAAERMNASGAHLAEFLKGIYSERLALEARHGPLLGEPAFAGPAPRSAPASAVAAEQSEERSRGVSSTATYEETFRRRTRLGFVASLTAAVGTAGIVAIHPPPQAPRVPPVVAAAALAQSPAPTTPAPKKTHAISIAVAPSGAEIYEGDRLIGKSPRLWADAPEGEHELRLQREGYLPQTVTLRVRDDGEQFRFRLRRRAPAHAGLGIKAER